MTPSANANIILSTSRKPSQRTRSLCKELQVMLPSSLYVQRGKSSFKELLHTAKQTEARRIFLVGEKGGNPGSIDLYSPDGAGAAKLLLSLEIHGVRLAREHGSRIRTPTETLRVVSDSNVTAGGLAAQLEKEFANSYYAHNESGSSRARVLTITEDISSGVKLSFRDSDGRELGPSMVAGWKK